MNFHIPVEFDYLAIFAWALAGAILGLRRHLDLIGVVVIATVSSIGGGLVRDGVLLQRTPPVLTEFWYLPLIALAALIAILFRTWVENSAMVERSVSAIDGLATPAFAVVGMELALQAETHWPGVMLVGCISGVGGGLIRDIMLGEVPEILKPGHYYVIPLIVTCALYLVATRELHIATILAGCAVVVVFFAFRALTLHYDWQTRPVLKRTLD